MIKVALVRGKYLNNFEGQNYLFKPNKVKITGISSYYPIHNNFPFKSIKLFSLSDINLGRFGKVLFNRLLGDSQILFGLEKIAPNFDILHTADPHYYYSYQLAKLRKSKLIKKLIVTSWETIPFNNETVERKKIIKYFTLKYSDYFICYTNMAKDCLIIEGVDENKIEVVRLGVDLKRFKVSHFAKASWDKQNSKIKTINILFVGSLVEEKGVLDLYEAYKNIKFQMSSRLNRDQINLKIIGDGPLRTTLVNNIKSDKLQNSISIDQKSYEEMPKVYRDADVFVLPSKKTKTWEEQYGMVLIEAMASGLPVVAYDTGAISELVDDVGLLVKEGRY